MQLIGQFGYEARNSRNQALRRSFMPRFLRCTSSSEMAAGVTPGIRAAWPRVWGLTCVSFWRTSLDRPRTALKSKFAGSGVSSWRRERATSYRWRSM